MRPKMFSDKGFVDGANVDLSFGSAAVMIVGIVTAAIVAGKKHAGNSVEKQTSATDKPWKQDWIKGIASEPIVNVWPNVPLWIKVPPKNLPRAKSSLRCILHRIRLENAANQRLKPE